MCISEFCTSPCGYKLSSGSTAYNTLMCTSFYLDRQLSIGSGSELEQQAPVPTSRLSRWPPKAGVRNRKVAKCRSSERRSRNPVYRLKRWEGVKFNS